MHSTHTHTSDLYRGGLERAASVVYSGDYAPTHEIHAGAFNKYFLPKLACSAVSLGDASVLNKIVLVFFVCFFSTTSWASN